MRRAGFTLVELLVTIAIIALLIALLLPGVQMAREAARRTRCANNLKQIGLALANYESVHEVLPSSTTSQIDFGVWSPDPTQYHHHSWAGVLLPYLEQDDVKGSINFDVSSIDPLNYDVAATILSVYRCPSFSGHDFSESPLYTVHSPRFAIRNYATMGATTVGKFWQHPDGVFYARSSTRMADLKDGATFTIFVVETREPDAAVWIDGGTAALTSHAYDENDPVDFASIDVGLNQSPYFTPFDNQGIDCLYGPSSMHPEGVMHVFGDGSVHFISETINGPVYDALVTRSGHEPVEPGDF